jgi:hypothetical protein
MRFNARVLVVATLFGVFACPGISNAEQPLGQDNHPVGGGAHSPLRVIEPLPPITIIDENGQPIQAVNERRWKPICGSDTSNMDQAAFEEIVRISERSLEGPVVVLNSGAERGAVFNVVFNVSGTPPTGATMKASSATPSRSLSTSALPRSAPEFSVRRAQITLTTSPIRISATIL